MTRYVYDTRTFRLQRQRTEGYNKSTVGDTVTYEYTGGTNKQDDGFNYDLVGNIVNIFVRVTDCGIHGINDNELDRTFEYDSTYRLTYADGRESDTQNGNDYLYEDAPQGSFDPSAVREYDRNYTYDKLGNIESVIQHGPNGFTRNYTYNTGKNTLDEIDDGSSTIESYSYDACGNTLTTNLNRKYEWNYSNQLICYKNQVGMGTPTVYAQYDYAGQERVSKIVRTGTAYERTIYIDGIFEYVSLGTFGVIDYEKNYIHIMDDKSRIAEKRIGDVFPGDIVEDSVFILEDQIGSAVMRTDSSGDEIDREEYYPFGDSSLRTFAYKRYRYVGKERDSESGLYYYGARYYAAWTCRFISVDPLANKYVHITPYNYADNNPINDFDIDGMQDGNTQQQGGSSNNNAPPAANQSTNTGAGTNSNNANKLPGFTPAAADPNIKSDSLRAAGTGGKGGATNKQNIQGKDKPTELYPTKVENLQQGSTSEYAREQQKAYTAKMTYGGDGSGSFFDNTMYVADKVLTTIVEAPATVQLPLMFVAPMAEAIEGIASVATVASDVSAISGEYSTIYRAVSEAEVTDVTEFGLRVKEGGYETGKLFAPTAEEAAQFGKGNFGLDGIPNTVLEVKIPNSVLQTAEKFGADGMNALSVPAEQLHLLRASPLNYSPLY